MITRAPKQLREMGKAQTRSFILLCVFIIQFCDLAAGRFLGTFVNRYLPGYVIKTVSVSGWLECIEECNNDMRCISYNYHFKDGVCEINDYGVQLQSHAYGTERLITRSYSIYHQLRATTVSK